MIAVQVLGQRKSPRALPRFAEILRSPGVPYLCREVVAALARYQTRDADQILDEARRHSATLVRRLAGEVISARDASGARS